MTDNFESESTDNFDENFPLEESNSDTEISLENKIINAVEKNFGYLICTILVEFLILNSYVYLKNIKRKEILKEIDIYLKSGRKNMINDLTMIENKAVLALLSEDKKIKILNQIKTLFGPEIDKLIDSVINLAKIQFFFMFSDLDIIKFRLKIGTYSCNYDKKQSSLKGRSSLKSISKISSSDGEFRWLGKFVTTKIFFPALVYQADMEKPYKLKIFNSLISDSSILNKTIKSLTGLAATCVLTYTILFYIKYVAEVRAFVASIFIILIFITLSIGLVFDNAKFRCVILLIIPFMASSRGRAVILMSCYTMCTKYVLPNALDNFDVLQEAFSCNKKMMSQQTKNLIRGNTAYQDFKEKVNYMRQVKENADNSLETAKKVIAKNAQYINKSYHSLKKIEIMNIDLFGNISTNCTYLMTKMYESCINLKGSMPKGLYFFLQGLRFFYFWYITTAEVSFRLYCRKLLNLMCPSFESVKAPYKKAKSYYRNFKNDIKSEINQRVDKLKSEFEFEIIEKEEDKTNKTGLKKKVLTVAQIYRNRLETLNTYLIKINFIFPISFLFLIYSALNFHSKYLKRDNFHNYLIGVKFYEIDQNRKAKKLPSILPLNPFFKVNYIELFSISLTKKERHVTIQSLIILTLLLVPVFFSVLLEEAIVAANKYTNSNTHVNIEYSDSDNSKVIIKNNGFLASTYKQIFRMFHDQKNINLKLDNKKCLPRHFSPDQSIRKYLMYSILVLYLLAIFQAYVKRLRSFFCGCVYPDRDLERANWLYTKLLALYSSIGLIERPGEDSKLWIKILKKIFWAIVGFIYKVLMIISFYYCFETIEKAGLQNMIRKYKVKFMPIYFKYFPPKFKYCLTCLAQSGYFLGTNDFLKCDSNECTGFYCIDCFIYLDNKCKICQRTISNKAYFSDEVIEKDSSDEDESNGSVSSRPETSYFNTKKEVVKITEDLEKIEIINLEKERAIEIICSCFKFLYFDLSEFIHDEIFLNMMKNSNNFKKIFRKNSQLIQDTIYMVVENYINNLSIEDCFSEEELEINYFKKNKLKK